MLHSNLSINEQGHLTVAGVDTVMLAEKYGTPLFVIDENRLRENCRRYTKAMREHFGENAMPVYASKALSFTGIYKIIAEEKMGADIVSSGELFTALKAGFPVKNMFFHGNNKTDFDIRYGIDSSIGYFVVDNVEELDEIDRYAGEKGVVQKIILRLTPGIDPHTFEAVSTGKVDSKFGVAIETGQADEMVKYALSKKNICLSGFHCHIGSQIFECSPFCDAADIMLGFIARMRDKYGCQTELLNLGGGFGVRYIEADPVVDIQKNIKTISEHMKKLCAELNISLPAIRMEPGRSIVADTCVTLYAVGSVKTITGYKSYVSIDGGMTDNPRYALYGSKYTALIASRANEAASFKCTIAGRCCESGDLIQENILIQKPVRGDVLAVLSTGAYNYSMASNYNRVCRPAIVMLKDGNDCLAVRREAFEDLTVCDM